MFERLLRKSLSDEEVRRLAAACGTLPARFANWTQYDHLVFGFIVDALVYSRDREGLVRLLSTRCPFQMEVGVSVDFYLAVFATRLKDPILVLGEAYAKCRVPESRRVIAALVRWAFDGLGIRGKDDGEFVNGAMHWYEKEKDHLVVNDAYQRQNDVPPISLFYAGKPELFDIGPGWEPLFKKRPASPDELRGGAKSAAAGPRPEDRVVDWAPPDYATGAEAEKAWARLEGTWKVIESVISWAPTRREGATGYPVVFHNQTVAWCIPDGTSGGRFRVRLGSHRQPRVMDLLHLPTPSLSREHTTALIYELQVETTSGIYELIGDSLRICLPRYGAWQRPDSFEARDGSGDTLYALKRVRE
jgi:uncharacterized protein (TIGR03067 family)